MWPLQMSSQPQSKATTCAPVQHKRRGQFWFCWVSRFWWGSRWLCSLISLQDCSVSSFLLNLYKYFTKQWRMITILGRTHLLLNYVVSLLCNQFDGEYIQSLSSVIFRLCVWMRQWRAPIVEFTHSFTCRCSDLVDCNDFIWCRLFKSCHWYVLIPVVSSLLLQNEFS